jgi:hypothetical protein
VRAISDSQSRLFDCSGGWKMKDETPELAGVGAGEDLAARLQDDLLHLVALGRREQIRDPVGNRRIDRRGHHRVVVAGRAKRPTLHRLDPLD